MTQYLYGNGLGKLLYKQESYGLKTIVGVSGQYLKFGKDSWMIKLDNNNGYDTSLISPFQ